MANKLRILHLEDLRSDELLVDNALKKSQLVFEKLVVETKIAFIKALQEFRPDVILSDHALPSFNSHDALEILDQSGLKIPFILITANISEEFAVDVIKRGADDYILKDRLQRLPTAITNSFEKFRLEKERQLFLDEIIINEKRYRALIENIHDGITLVTTDSTISYQSPSAEYITGFTFGQVKGKNIFDVAHPDDKDYCMLFFQEVATQPGLVKSGQYRILHKKGHFIWLEVTITNLLHDESVKAFIVTYRDITKRKLAEDALKQSEFSYRQIVETAQEGIWLLDENNRTTFVNQKMCDILEYPKEEIIGRENLYFMDDQEKQSVLQSMNRAKAGVMEALTVRYITKTGKQIWTNISGNPVFNNDGLYQGALAMVSDITEKKKLEDLLERSNNLARIGNWELDVATRILHWSPITRQIHEIEHDIKIELDVAITYYKEGFSRDAISRALQEAIEHGTSWDMEIILITSKKNERWVRVLGDAEWQNGKCVRLYGSFQDINARKTTELEYLEACQEKNSILESIGDAFFAVDKKWIVTYWNHEAERLTGHLKEVLLGASLWTVFANRIGSDAYTKYQEAMTGGDVVHFEEYNEIDNKWYEVSVYPSELGLSVYFRDVTERKQTWVQLNELNITLAKSAKELATSNAELEQFAYVASHDLQEPLRMVTSFLTQIDKRYTALFDEKGKQYIHFAVDGAKRMRQIILDLLEFSRVGRLQTDPEKVDVQKLINDILLLYSTQVEECGAVVSFAGLPEIYTYETPLRQVFQNLLSNAFKYRAAGVAPAIVITCIEHDDSWQFAVQDNGIGIESGYFEKIFVIFQRLHSREEYSGTGMGLAICKKIVETMNGRIWVESSEGKGTTFLFTLAKQLNNQAISA
ncbi:MAG: PAS domain S-box protein [Chitinophagaceae bacterium]